MAAEKQEGPRLRDKMRHPYRLVIMNDETFEEMGSYRLSLLNVYAIVCITIVLVALLIVAIIAFTPAKRLIPGYGDVSQHTELMRMNKQLEEMEAKLSAQNTYTETVKKILVGDVIEPTSEETEEGDFSDTTTQVERIREDELLRREIALDEQLQNKALLDQTSRMGVGGSIPLEQMYFVPPISGIVSMQYMPDKAHYGIDVLAPKNTPVLAVMDGYVFEANWNVETGNTIGVQHDNNVISFYKHNSALLKKVGDQVKAGEAVAIIGNTGAHSDGPHLHFEIWHKGHPVVPGAYIVFE